MTDQLWGEVDIRVIDQRIGVGIGGMDTVVRVYPRYTSFAVYLADQCGLADLTEGQRLDDLDSHLAVNPELAGEEEEDDGESDY